MSAPVVEASRGLDLLSATERRLDGLIPRAYYMEGRAVRPTHETFASLPMADGRTFELLVERRVYDHAPILSFNVLPVGFSGLRKSDNDSWFNYFPDERRFDTPRPAREEAGILHEEEGLRHVNHMLDIAVATIRAQPNPTQTQEQMYDLFEELTAYSALTYEDSEDPDVEVLSLTTLMPGYTTRKVTTRYHVPTGRLQEIAIAGVQGGRVHGGDDFTETTEFIARFIPDEGGDLTTELETIARFPNAGMESSHSKVLLDPKTAPDLRALTTAQTMLGMLTGSVRVSSNLNKASVRQAGDH